MANIRIPQYERKVQLNANQSPAVRLAEPIPEPDYGKAIQQAGAAIASIGSSVNAIGDRLLAREKQKQQQNFALIEAEYDNAVQQALQQIAQTDTTKTEWGRTADENFKNILNKSKESLKEKYPSYFSTWEGSDRGKIAEIKTGQALNKVITKLNYDQNIADMNTLLDQKITNVLLTGENVSGATFNQAINAIVDSYKDTLSERDLRKTRNNAAGRAYALYVDKTINRGNQKDVEALIGRLKAHKDGIPENFEYMQAEDRAKYIEFLGRAKNAMQGTALESNADNLLKQFFTYVEQNTVLKDGQNTPAANKMIAIARDYPETFCRQYNISRRQLTTLTNVMEQVLAGSPQGAAASMGLERFDVRWKMLKGDDKTKMSTVGALYGELRQKAASLEWGATKTDQNKIKKILTEMETTAALIAQDGVKAQYTTPWYDFAHQTNDEYIKSELPRWIKSMTVQEEISDEMLGQAYLYAYELMERKDITAKLSTAEEKQELQSGVKAYLSQMIKGLNNNLPDGSKLNMPKYQKYQIPEGLPDRKSYLKE